MNNIIVLILKYSAYLQWLPLLGQLVTFVHEAEQTFRSPGSGAQKLSAVIGKFVPLVQSSQAAGLINARLAGALISGASSIIGVIVAVVYGTGTGNVAGAQPVNMQDSAAAPGPYNKVLANQPVDDDLQVGDTIYHSEQTNTWYIIPSKSFGSVPSGYEFVNVVHRTNP